ncbi:MAG: GntR family transcriptional regulator [Lentisphaeria bacterium]|nr:GntR family transcriptional regulator [Lentisphaeria bacterium]MBQ9775297.1 GntR family transcriptional regulator [Lentisphaeria bacterium]
MDFSELKISLTENKAYPKYMQLRDQVEEYIKSHKIPANTQLPDIISLCKIAGLSNRSVERAYTMLINDGVCFRRPKKGTFVCDRKPTTDVTMPQVCGILAPKCAANLENNDIFGSIYRGIQAKAQEANIDIIILSERSLPVYRAALGDNLLGVLMLDWYSPENARKIVENFPGLKLIFVNLHLPEFESMPDNVSGIFNDDFSGGFAAGDYIFDQGCRKPRVLSLALASDNYQRRVSGIRRAAQLHGIKWNSDWEFYSGEQTKNRDDHFEIAHNYIMELVSQKESFDAVFCTNDLLAAGVAATLDNLHLRDKVKVIGYDNILPYLSSNGKFPTVAVDLEKMGNRAVAALVDKEPLPKVQNIAPQLIFR